MMSLSVSRKGYFVRLNRTSLFGFPPKRRVELEEEFYNKTGLKKIVFIDYDSALKHVVENNLLNVLICDGDGLCG